MLLFLGICFVVSGCGVSKALNDLADSISNDSVPLTVKNSKTATINVQVGTLDFGDIGPGKTTEA